VEGLKVRAYGAVKVYERNGSYQLNVFTLQPAGVGELQFAFEQLKKKLAAEGLFETARKRPVPSEVLSVGVITSPDGAAIRDIITVIRRRAPFV
jgi:exodeoxyribonuclease VII large subunit